MRRGTARALPGAPVPYSEEALYGAFARTGLYLGVASPKALAFKLFGSRSALAVPDLPSRLADVCQWAHKEWGLSPVDLLVGHTSLAYHTHLHGRAVFEQYTAALQATSSHAHLRLGICASVVRGTEWFRLCADCVRYDMAVLGEAYWRRSHQLPGVLVCPLHAARLVETRVPYRPFGRHNFVPASEEVLLGGQEIAVEQRDLDLAQRLARELQAAAANLPHVRFEPIDYRSELRRLGYVGRHGGVAVLAERVLKHLGTLAPMLFKNAASPSVAAWIAAAARKPRRHLHPVQHYLLLDFMAVHGSSMHQGSETKTGRTDRRGISRCPDLRKQAADLAALGYRNRRLARLLRVDSKTVARLLAPIPQTHATSQVKNAAEIAKDRAEWNRLIEAHPGLSRTELRKLNRALFARLYRNQRRWLQSAGPARRRPAQKGRGTPWKARDQALAHDIQNEARRIREAMPPRRASASRITSYLRARARMAHCSHRLPLSVAAIKVANETVRDFQVRRLVAAIRSDRRGLRCPDWFLLRAAGINPKRFADGALGLLADARRVVSCEQAGLQESF